ncbi:hypothetical protein C8Q80DRAFT_255802 [Daedaleopsis nitida]|nr:hypothetical protein C8Q80DRAFT_255802 [Daedaleopsis nitida]
MSTSSGVVHRAQASTTLLPYAKPRAGARTSTTKYRAAIRQLGGICYQGNPSKFDSSRSAEPSSPSARASWTSTGPASPHIADGVNYGGYLQNILNSCKSGGRVGGYLWCNVQVL